MTLAEISEKAAADSVERIRVADEEAELSSSAFAMGLGDRYLQGVVHDINRRINDRFGLSGDGASNAQSANPADLGKPNP